MFFKDGSVPEEFIRFGSECIEVDSWSTRRQYNAFKESLGTGVLIHLQVNCHSFYDDQNF